VGRLASALAVLCPSDWDEPFGLVAAEAQAAGTPVVAFARGGLTEIIDHAVTGFLVEPGNVARRLRLCGRGEPGPATLPAARGR
jgi:glycosyltransferase involved in cell wall biosynthesis